MSDNVLITEEDVEEIMNAIRPIGDKGTRLRPRNLVFYQTAFVHKSYLHESDPKLGYTPTQSNEVLEFLGDSFIGAVVAKYLVDRFDDQQEGFLTKTRTVLVRSQMLHQFARHLMMGTWILLSPQVSRLTYAGSNKGRNNPRLYEDCFEAFVGAMIEDFQEPDDPVSGSRFVYRFLVGIIEHLVDFADIILFNTNTKDTLQRYFQSLKWVNPVYIELYETEPPQTKVFTKGVFLKKEYLPKLSAEVQKQVIEYHVDSLKGVDPRVRLSILRYSYPNVLTEPKDGDGDGNVAKKETKRNKELSASINAFIAENEPDHYLIGLGIGNKKNIAEQMSSSIALCCLNIHHNWEGDSNRV